MKKYVYYIFVLLAIITLVGCDSRDVKDNIFKSQEADLSEEEMKQTYSSEFTCVIDEIKHFLGAPMGDFNKSYDDEIIKNMIGKLSAASFPVIDMDNQFDMVNYTQVHDFCESVEAEKEDAIIILQILSNDSFIINDLKTERGKVRIKRNTIEWKDSDDFECINQEEFDAYTWNYTEKGYLFFEQYYPPGGITGHTAIRVKPLDNKLRQLNKKYILPISYESNNLFLTNWYDSNFGELCFLDLYERLYLIKYKQYPPITDKTEKIDKDDFETIIKTYFNISDEVLSDLVQLDDSGTAYKYRRRGIYECSPTPYLPFSEVVDFVENSDGTITLYVEAVWPEKNTDLAFSHMVTVKPLENNDFKYISNQLIESDNDEMAPYIKRLSDEELSQIYGGNR